jgi:hypothetical protein
MDVVILVHNGQVVHVASSESLRYVIISPSKESSDDILVSDCYEQDSLLKEGEFGKLITPTIAK